jgi:hypothetical protein
MKKIIKYADGSEHYEGCDYHEIQLDSGAIAFSGICDCGINGLNISNIRFIDRDGRDFTKDIVEDLNNDKEFLQEIIDLWGEKPKRL